MAEKTTKKAMLNTTVNKETLDNFRDFCKSINTPMNMVLEIFMAQFAQGQFEFKLTKNKSGENKMELDID